jgi:hypothetical protein
MMRLFRSQRDLTATPTPLYGLPWLLVPLFCCGMVSVAAGMQPVEPAVAPLPANAPFPAASAPRATEGRHQIGAAVGGSGVFQLAYRLRVTGPLHLELGGFGLPHSPVHATVGVLAALPVSDRWRPYLGLAVGHAGIQRQRYPAGCEHDAPGCQPTQTLDYINYVSGRVGVGYAFGLRNRHMLGLDVGVWYGTRGTSRTAPDGTETPTSHRILWPMGGLSYLFRI